MASRCVYAFLVAMLIGTATAAAQAPNRHAAVAPPGQPPGQNAPAQPPPGQQPGGSPETTIAAVVNDDVITVFDVLSRVRMIMVSSNIPDTPEMRQRLAPQVLRGLIDEKLQLQEAKKQNITVTEAELNKGIEQIEKQNNMKPGQLNDFLHARGIDRGALVDQLTASLVWAKLVKREAAQATAISDDEIDDAMKRLKEHAGEPESRVAEIFLAVDNPAQEEQVHQLAERLSAQMKQGARFSAVARQFSQSASAAVGGDIGYMRADQLPPELAKTAATLRPGELSAPIRSGGGYYLLLVLDRRTGAVTGSGQEPTFDIVQVVFPFPQQASEAARRHAMEEAESVRAVAKDCPTMLKIGKERAPELSSEGKLAASQIAPEMRKVIETMPTGQVSQPIVQKNGVGVIMICDKSTGASPGKVGRDDVAETIMRQRIDTLSRRYMRDLRRTAYVDLRAGGS
ncbi:MAG: peptidylprolyl isomerase [Alphaproteobacteria bacterium]|nr:peptidylprolyl isomerase [Alphaproteobacteria bacterium]MBV9584378.1 peptidylprolyl isomerase [Alphaproteobacteria bacterium]